MRSMHSKSEELAKVFPFGKFLRKRIDSAPTSYLTWVLRKVKKAPYKSQVFKAIHATLKFRDKVSSATKKVSKRDQEQASLHKV